MKVFNEKSNRYIRFEDLPVGEFFLLDGILHLKTDSYENAYCFEDEHFCEISPSDPIIPISAKTITITYSD